MLARRLYLERHLRGRAKRVYSVGSEECPKRYRGMRNLIVGTAIAGSYSSRGIFVQLKCYPFLPAAAYADGPSN